jgi:hypothetical protein
LNNFDRGPANDLIYQVFTCFPRSFVYQHVKSMLKINATVKYRYPKLNDFQLQIIMHNNSCIRNWTKQLLIGTFKRSIQSKGNYLPPNSLHLTGGKYICNYHVTFILFSCHFYRFYICNAVIILKSWYYNAILAKHIIFMTVS